MTNHSCQGIKLPDNIFFTGACHPYRFKEKIIKDNNTSKKNSSGKNDLEYKVNPLPFSLLNFVVNFCKLEDEKNYINNMVEKAIDNFFFKEIEEENKIFDKKVMHRYLSREYYNFNQNLKKLSSEAIIRAQNFIRQKNGISSVSLYDVRRFCVFYDFFVEYFRKNK